MPHLTIGRLSTLTGNDTPPLALDMEENKKSEGLSIPANQDILDKLGEPEAETISINNNLPQRRSSLSDEFDSVLDLESRYATPKIVHVSAFYTAPVLH